MTPRIVAGELGSRRLQTPKGRTTRPTSDRAREALFARLGEVEGATVLDLFAGSGALGFEALSRGAASVTFADTDPAALAVVRANAEALGVLDRCRLLRSDFRRVLRDEAAAGHAYSLLLLDPPYTLLPRFLPALRQLLPPVLAPQARVVLEAPAGLDPDLGLPDQGARRYGAADVHLYAT
jgi:16S rRNA (guanine966-N2)-methyltransferase